MKFLCSGIFEDAKMTILVAKIAYFHDYEPFNFFILISHPNLKASLETSKANLAV